MYRLLSRLFLTYPPSGSIRRILIVRPCCIGDVVLATAVLNGLRRHYPDAHITWAVGGWSRRAIARHPAVDSILDTGARANPTATPLGFIRFVRLLRKRYYDLVIGLVRSPVMSLALGLSGIPHRVGLDSAGRGFGYTVRVPVVPATARHEAEIYLDTLRAIAIPTDDCYAEVPVHADDQAAIARLQLPEPYIVLNPTGGHNPGMTFDTKRWPPAYFAALANHLTATHGTHSVLLGGPDDGPILDAVMAGLDHPGQVFCGMLSFGEIGALAARSAGYIGNDTGLTHLAAASGARTVMILGPTDPARYAPYTPASLALWKPATLPAGGVAAADPTTWDWARDGIDPATVIRRVDEFLFQPATR
jgi:heptosyltransferase II